MTARNLVHQAIRSSGQWSHFTLVHLDSGTLYYVNEMAPKGAADLKDRMGYRHRTEKKYLQSLLKAVREKHPEGDTRILVFSNERELWDANREQVTYEIVFDENGKLVAQEEKRRAWPDWAGPPKLKEQGATTPKFRGQSSAPRKHFLDEGNTQPAPKPKPNPCRDWLSLKQVKASSRSKITKNSEELVLGIVGYQQNYHPLYAGTAGGLLNVLGLDKIKNRPMSHVSYNQDGTLIMSGLEIELTDLSRAELKRIVDRIPAAFPGVGNPYWKADVEVQLTYTKGKILLRILPVRDTNFKSGWSVKLLEHGGDGWTKGPAYGTKKRVDELYNVFLKKTSNIDEVRELPYIWQRESLPQTAIAADNVPTPESNLIYLAYFVDEKVVKIGRTSNWEGRGRTYAKAPLKTGEKSKTMQLLDFHYTDPNGVAQEDATPRSWILYCYEDVLKDLAKNSPHLEQDKALGEEYYRLTSDLSLVIESFRERFDNISLKEVLSIREGWRLNAFCKDPKHRRDPDKLREELDRLVELDEMG